MTPHLRSVPAHRVPLLGRDFPLPLDQPFSRSQAIAAGIPDRRLGRLVQDGLLRRMVHGVYVAAQARESRDLRIAALKLVVPPGVVLVDTTASWLHIGAAALGPNQHLHLHQVEAYSERRGYRLRNTLVDSGSRGMRPEDVMEVDGLLVVTPLRAALDAGRLLQRDQAFAAMDALQRLANVRKDELLAQIERFKGYRGVRQLRNLAPETDARAESYGESVLRRRWLDQPGLPPPELQVPVLNPYGGYWWIDLGVPELRFGAEYDGARWHGPEREDHDRWRRETIMEMHDVVVDVFVRQHVFGAQQDAGARLLRAIMGCRRRLGEFRPGA